jgi:hypothetical protein
MFSIDSLLRHHHHANDDCNSIDNRDIDDGSTTLIDQQLDTSSTIVANRDRQHSSSNIAIVDQLVHYPIVTTSGYSPLIYDHIAFACKYKYFIDGNEFRSTFD